jgi:hypothetical protein
LRVGRYPGLLLIDAPGGHETNDDDLRSMLQGLIETSIELPTLQVVVASARGRVVDEVVSADHQRRPNEAGYLW